MTSRDSFSLAALFILGWMVQASAETARGPKQVLELMPQSATALSNFEVEISNAGAAKSQRQQVTDAVLFMSKSGGDVQAALHADEGEAPSQSATLFSVRLFIVAGGKLYSGGRAKCGSWFSNVSKCSVACDGGAFALRRNGAAPLELLVGAIPGGSAADSKGVMVSECGFDEASDARLVPGLNRGLAVAGFGSE
jgi:hypothetical protein